MHRFAPSTALAVALTVSIALAHAAAARQVSCRVSNNPEQCRTQLTAALRADAPDTLVVLGAMPGACRTRAQGAAALWHALGGGDRKIIVSGSNPHNNAADLRTAAGRRAQAECHGLPGARTNSEAELMCAYIRLLTGNAAVPLANIILEPHSGSTVQNANNSVRIAKERGAQHVLVVTTGYSADYGHANSPQSHARRALGDFCHARSAQHATFKLSGVDYPVRGTPVWSYDVDHSCGGASSGSGSHAARRR
jgi:hypothetical protein